MEKQTFRKRKEGTGKLQRAKLSSCQLPTYWSAGATGCASATNTSRSTHRPARPLSTTGRSKKGLCRCRPTRLLTRDAHIRAVKSEAVKKMAS